MFYRTARILVFAQLVACGFGYYWKDYHGGTIPENAIVAGTDINDENVYIGQAFANNKNHPGVYPTSILKGQDVYVQLYGIVKAGSFIQILCADSYESYEWIPANSTSLHVLPTSNKLVWGGVEDQQLLGVGRVKYQGSAVVGKVLAGNINEAEFYFVHNGQGKSSNSYEVLTYSILHVTSNDVQFNE